MNELNCLFQYLKREGVFIERSKFIFHLKSHPDYPSLLAISDTLTLNHVKNGAINVGLSEISILPNRFIAALREEKGVPEFYLIEKREEEYFCLVNNDLFKMPLLSLEERWTNLVFLVEQSENGIIKSNKNVPKLIIFILCLGLFILIIHRSEVFILTKLFFLLPFIGILFSVAVLKDLFEVDGDFLNKFCKTTPSIDCSIIVNSNRWKIFEIINFSDLSIVFFSNQVLGLFLSILTGDSTMFLYLQEILLFCSVPVIVLSLYFQKFIEKKWCFLCLSIIGILLAELFYLNLFVYKNSSITIQWSLLVAFGFISIVLFWINLKRILMQNKELRVFQIKSNRFQRNYKVFKNSLIVNGKIDLPINPLILGSKEGKVIITILTDVFCSHCEKAHKILNAILIGYGDIQINIILKTDIKKTDEENTNIHRTLALIYDEEGESIFKNALDDWYKEKNVMDWLKLYRKNYNNQKNDMIFKKQYDWCFINEVNFTPAIFINGYQYPDAYEIENLEYFIVELLDDTKLN